MKMSQLPLWDKSCVRTSSLDFARDIRLSELRVLELLLDRQLNPYHLSRNAPLFPDDLPPGHFYDNLIGILRHLTGTCISTIKCVRTCIEYIFGLFFTRNQWVFYARISCSVYTGLMFVILLIDLRMLTDTRSYL